MMDLSGGSEQAPQPSGLDPADRKGAGRGRGPEVHGGEGAGGRGMRDTVRATVDEPAAVEERPEQPGLQLEGADSLLAQSALAARELQGRPAAVAPQAGALQESVGSFDGARVSPAARQQSAGRRGDAVSGDSRGGAAPSPQTLPRFPSNPPPKQEAQSSDPVGVEGGFALGGPETRGQIAAVHAALQGLVSMVGLACADAAALSTHLELVSTEEARGVASLRGFHSASAAEVAALHGETEQMAADAAALRREVFARSEDIAELRASVEAKAKAVAALEEEAASAAARMTALEAAADGRAAELLALEGHATDLAANVAAAAVRADALEREAATEATREEVLRREADAARERVETLRAEVDRRLAEASALQLESESRATEMAALQREADDGAAQLDRLRGEVARRAGEISALESEVDARRKEAEAALEDVSAQRRRAAALVEEVTALRGEVAAAEEEAASMRRDADSAAAAAAKLQAEGSARAEDVARLKGEVDRKTHEVMALEEQVAALAERLSVLWATKNAKADEVLTLEALTAGSVERAGALRAGEELSGLRDEYESTAAEAARLRGKAEAQRRMVARLRGQEAAAAEEMASMRAAAIARVEELAKLRVSTALAVQAAVEEMGQVVSSLAAAVSDAQNEVCAARDATQAAASSEAIAAAAVDPKSEPSGTSDMEKVKVQARRVPSGRKAATQPRYARSQPAPAVHLLFPETASVSSAAATFDSVTAAGQDVGDASGGGGEDSVFLGAGNSASGQAPSPMEQPSTIVRRTSSGTTGSEYSTLGDADCDSDSDSTLMHSNAGYDHQQQKEPQATAAIVRMAPSLVDQNEGPKMEAVWHAAPAAWEETLAAVERLFAVLSACSLAALSSRPEQTNAATATDDEASLTVDPCMYGTAAHCGGSREDQRPVETAIVGDEASGKVVEGRRQAARLRMMAAAFCEQVSMSAIFLVMSVEPIKTERQHSLLHQSTRVGALAS